MKITTQRTLVWTANFVLVAAMLGLVVIMAANVRRDRDTKRKSALSDLDSRIRKTTSGAGRDESASPGGGQLANVLNGVFVGPVAPPPPTSVPTTPTGKIKPPDIAGLLEIVGLYASSGKADPALPVDPTGSGVVLRLKSKTTPGSNTFFYRDGEVIGMGVKDPAEKEPTMEKFGGAKILGIEDKQIRLMWGDDEVMVKVTIDIEPKGGRFVDNKGNVLGSDQSSGRANATAALEEDFKLLPPQEGKDTVEITESGMRTLDERGELLLESAGFDSADGENGTKALKITSLPPELAERGFRESDVIIRIDNEAVTTRESIISYVKRTYKGKSSYLVTLLRDGNTRVVEVKVPKGIDLIRARQGNRTGTAIPTPIR